MPSYLVSSRDRIEWREDPEDFARALEDRWPDAEIRQDPPDSPMALTFELEEHGESVLGRLHGDGQAIEMDADVPASAEIAAWWRTRVPDDVKLVFYDERYNSDVPVDPGADGAAVASAFPAA